MTTVQVPREPTLDMVRAAENFCAETEARPKGLWWWKRLYQAYIAAAPAAQPVNQQLLEALNTMLVASTPTGGPFDAAYMEKVAKPRARAAIAAAAEAQPAEQEPVAHICILPTKDAGPTKFFTSPSDPRGFPVYTHPQPNPAKLAAWQAEVMELADEFARTAVDMSHIDSPNRKYWVELRDEARAALEQKIKERP